MSTQTIQYKTASQDLMNFITRANADQQLHVIFYCRGRLDENLLARAMRIAMDCEPVLGCRFIQHGNRTTWERRDDLDRLALCPVVATQMSEPALMAFVTQPADPSCDPLVQARLFRGPQDDTLCLKVNHVVADGGGTKEAAYLVCACYNRLLEDPTYTPALGRPGARSQLGFFRQAGLKNMIQYRPRTFKLRSSQFSLPIQATDAPQRAFGLRRLSASQFQALKDYGRRHGATINDLILTALYRAFFDLSTPPQGIPLPVQVSIDLRSFLPPAHPQTICNLSGGLFPAIEYRPGETFADTLEQVKAQMQRWKSRRPGLTGAMLIELAMLQGFTRANAMVANMTKANTGQVNPLLLSNFGALDAARLRLGPTEIQDVTLLGPIMLRNGFMLTASTYNQQMTLASGYCTGRLSRPLMESLLEAVYQGLLGCACQTK